MKAHVSADDLEKLANGKAALRDIQQLTSSIVITLRTADAPVRDVLKNFLNEVHSDVMKSGIKDAEKLTLDKTNRRIYLLNGLGEMVEKASFYRGDVRMFHSHIFLDHFYSKGKWSPISGQSEDELFSDSLGPDAKKRIIEHFVKLVKKSYVANRFSYLPFSEILKAGSIEELLDGTILSRR